MKKELSKELSESQKDKTGQDSQRPKIFSPNLRQPAVPHPEPRTLHSATGFAYIMRHAGLRIRLITTGQ